MINQYTNSYTSIPSEICYIMESKISILDKYVILKTDEYEYSALVYNTATKETVEYRFYRITQSGYTSTWNIETIENREFTFNIANEYYAVSNVGYGKQLDLDVYESVPAFCSCIMCCTLIFAIVFKGVLFKCLDRR